eukprot:6485161-Amphidinium_carterae.2
MRCVSSQKQTRSLLSTIRLELRIGSYGLLCVVCVHVQKMTHRHKRIRRALLNALRSRNGNATSSLVDYSAKG